MEHAPKHGPLAGVRVVEFASLGPVPFAGMLLSDMGADVVRIERSGVSSLDRNDVTARGRRFVALDLKSPKDLETTLDLLEGADVLMEGYRPRVMERLGLGPDVVTARNPRLVYARMTGWGQSGPLADRAGHDINYVALTGALAAIGTASQPVVPLNLVGDYGGGALYLVTGILAALIEARSSQLGQVVDCAMVDGTLSLLSLFHGWLHSGDWRESRASNLLDGAAPFYGVYICKDGKHVALGAIEPQFYATFCERAELDWHTFSEQNDEKKWPKLREKLKAHFLTKTRDEWCERFEGLDACLSPVLTMKEAAAHEHIKARSSIVHIDGVMQSAPAPRFQRTPSQIRWGAAQASTRVTDLIDEWRQPPRRASISAV